MDFIVEPGVVNGRIKAPPSKSYTHRALFASLLAQGESTLVDPLISGDTMATMEAVRGFGAAIKGEKPDRITVRSGSFKAPRSVYCRGSGTTIRIATAISSLFKDEVILYGDETLNRRPMGPLAEALRSLGARIRCAAGCTPPLSVRGFNWRPLHHRVAIDGSISSQFVTALLMISPLVGLEVEVEGTLRSRPYVDVTIRVLEEFGLKIERRGYRFFRVKGSYRPRIYRVPGDYSSASFMLAAGALAGSITVENLDPEDPQADRAIVGVLRAMGAKVIEGDGWILVEEAGGLEPIDVDLSDAPDIAPITSVLAAYARGTSTIRGVGHLAYKESNRLEAIISNLSSIGVEASMRDKETLVIRGGTVKGGYVDSFDDHRIAMAFAIAGLRAESPIRVFNADRISDSYPDFVRDLKSAGAKIQVVVDKD